MIVSSGTSWRVLEKKGFNKKWITWIMHCVRTVSFLVFINESPYGDFQESQGIRQGDPLSPYLFILCSDVHSLLISTANKMDGYKAIFPSQRRSSK